MELMKAVKEVFHDCHPSYHLQVVMRYEGGIYDIPVEMAIKAVRGGYSSPGAAMADGIIPHYPQVERGLFYVEN